MQQLQAFCRHIDSQSSYAREITARMIKAIDETNLDRVGAEHENDRDCLRGPFCGKRRWGPTRRSDHGHRTANQFSCKRWQPIVMAFRPAVFYRHIPTIDITSFGQASLESSNFVTPRLEGLAVEKPDRRHGGLLCAHCKRPRSRRAAKQADELPPSHGGSPEFRGALRLRGASLVIKARLAGGRRASTARARTVPL